MRKILVLNGPNLQLLGRREPELYGSQSYAELCKQVVKHGFNLKLLVEVRQTNWEGQFIDWISEAMTSQVHALIVNPGAWTHYSLAIRDALACFDKPWAEVHLTDPSLRPGREFNVLADLSHLTFKGNLSGSYLEALDHLASENMALHLTPQ